LLSDERWYARARHGYARGLESRHTVDRVQQFLQVLENRAALR
jgi:membrane-bound lytic murein transglycosylase MltF